MSIIKNKEQLSISTLRRQALKIVEAGINACNLSGSLSRHIKFDQKKNILYVDNKQYVTDDHDSITLVGMGTSMLPAIRYLKKILGYKINRSYVIGNSDSELFADSWEVLKDASIHEIEQDQLTQKLLALDAHDLVIVLIPEQTDTVTTTILKKAGASGEDINTVAKHTNFMVGGNLAKICYPASVIALYFPRGDNLDIKRFIGSPTILDRTTMYDAAKILQAYNVLDMNDKSSLEVSETPKNEIYFERIQNIVIPSAHYGLQAMNNKALDLGFRGAILPDLLYGTPLSIGNLLSQKFRNGYCVLTTLEYENKVSGRNHDLALSVFGSIQDNQLLIAFSPEVQNENITVGTLIDANLKYSAKIAHLDSSDYLSRNDSYNFFDQLDSHIQIESIGAIGPDFLLMLS